MRIKRICLVFFFNTVFVLQSAALTGTPNAHDPSPIIKEGNTYWIFATTYPWSKSAVGNGIYTSHSTDLINWTPGKRIFDGSWPKWINTYVPKFAGNFWAPHVIYLNGLYYMYYACSVYQTPTAVIGVASSPTLDPGSPNYKWTDLGMVAHSAVNTDVNAIDPSAFVDANGKVYLTYGSYSAGIGIIEINAKTGLPLKGVTVKIIAGGGRKAWEASCLVKVGSYYYLFVNRGGCCLGTSSTYYIVAGRSLSPTGPFLDQTGKNLVGGNGTLVLGSSGKYTGPGHFGLFQENQVNYVTTHYYYGTGDGDANLDIARLDIKNGWPVITRDWLPDGSYTLQNKNNGLAWEVTGCKTTGTSPISQNILKNSLCQKWNLKSLGDGFYSFTSALNGTLAAEVNQCVTGNGAKIQTGVSSNSVCQKFKIEKTADGHYVLTPSNTTKVIEIPGNLNTAGTQLALYDYNGCNCQKWDIAPFGSVITGNKPAEDPNIVTVSCYPNPFSGTLTVLAKGEFAYTVYNVSGHVVEEDKGLEISTIGAFLQPGIYTLKVTSSGGTVTQKVFKK